MYTPKLNMYTKVEGLKRLASYLKEQSLTPRFLVRCESFFLSLSLSHSIRTNLSPFYVYCPDIKQSCDYEHN